MVTVDVDRTPPSSKVSVEYDDIAVGDDVVIKGKAEKNTTIIIEGDTDTYEVETGEDGSFEISSLTLKPGKNLFKLRVKDDAGNEVLSSTTIEIEYEAGDVNGDGVVIGPDGKPLPESAGELDKAMDFLMGNKLMLGFALIAMAVFGVSSASAYALSKKRPE